MKRYEYPDVRQSDKCHFAECRSTICDDTSPSVERSFKPRRSQWLSLHRRHDYDSECPHPHPPTHSPIHPYTHTTTHIDHPYQCLIMIETIVLTGVFRHHDAHQNNTNQNDIQDSNKNTTFSIITLATSVLMLRFDALSLC